MMNRIFEFLISSNILIMSDMMINLLLTLVINFGIQEKEYLGFQSSLSYVLY